MPDIEMTGANRKMVADTIAVLRSQLHATNDALYRLYGLLSANPDGRTVGPAPEMGGGGDLHPVETPPSPAI